MTMLPKIPKWILFIHKNIRKIGLGISFGLTTYKAFDYRQRYLVAEEQKDLLHKGLDEKSMTVTKLNETYNNVLLRLSMDNYQMDDIRLPFWYKIYDAHTDDFRMVKFNRAYEEIYGMEPSGYFTKNDNEVIGDIGEQYQLNDRKVFESGKVEEFFENYIDRDGNKKVGKYAKWRVDKPSGTYIYGIQLEL
ncbi:hypothetical protein ACOKFD_15585 [Flagellimonas sp. S174]|uniref:hypothetical protein n=1 Tax=Flagellimonas sp. S174 TaxID=3410790 RepID=UPI003BF5F099